MKINKEHLEFFQVDTSDSGGWQSPPGYPSGIQQRILTGSLDHENKAGFYTRLLRFLPGAYSTEPFVHDYWEEVFVVSGDLWVESDENGQGGKKFVEHTYCCRPPHVPHGPFRSEKGCLLIEMHYYESE